MLLSYLIFSKYSKLSRKRLLHYRNSPLDLGLFRFTLLTLSAFFWIFFFSESQSLPPVWPDEVLFFSPSIQLANFGILRTDVLVGLIPGMESKTLWMPPGYLLVSALFFKVLPQTLATARLVSFLSIYFSAIVFIFVLFKLNFNKISVILGFATILMEPLFYRFGIPARMEGTTILFFLISLLFALSNLSIFLKSFFTGLFFSFACLSHPFALSLTLVVLYVLIFESDRRVQKFLFFLVGGFLPFLAWMVYISPDWNLFFIQFGAQLARKKSLFASFDLLTKLKIFMFGFAYSKFRILVILSQIMLLFIFTGQLFRGREKIPQRFVLYWVWILSVLISIYSSSEGWYVIHFLFPFGLGIAILSEQKYIGRMVSIFGVMVSVLGWFHYIDVHHIKTNSDVILSDHFARVYQSVKDYKKVYIQSIPDPYFYLKTKNPRQEILEFIPGELAIPSSTFKNTISEQEAFIFYNDDLRNQAIIDFLQEHPDWIREEWTIPVPPEHWLHFKTVIYRKPLMSEG
jgi:hypothetical protein